MKGSSRTLAFAADLPAWMEALRDRAGPMLAAAHDLARWKGPAAFPEGRVGIRLLGRLVEEAVFDESLTDEDDARFVEGAGAMLGLLLIAHVGLGRHRERDGRHRIELGELGFFDPFGAIDAALDADRPQNELARRVAMAEAEANGDGPVAKTTALLIAGLARHGHTRRIRDRFEAWVALDDGVEIDLARFVTLASDDDADLPGAIDRLVSMLGAEGGSAERLSWAEAQGRLLPRLAAPAFVEELSRERGSAPIACRELATGLMFTLVLAFEGRSRFVRAREVAFWTESAGVDPFAFAITRLDERLDATRWQGVTVGERACYSASRGDGLAAALILSARMRHELAQKLGSVFLIGVPHRDRLLASADAVEAPELRAHVADEMRRAPHGIAGHLFRITSDAGTEPWIEALS
jgi:hypothetical protein